MALTLSPEIQDAIDTGIYSPVLMVELDIAYEDGTQTFYASDSGGEYRDGVSGYSYEGHFYRQEIVEDIGLTSSKDETINGISFGLDNTSAERYWSERYNLCSANEWVQSVVRVYRTFRGVNDRIQIYEGFLEIPNNISDVFPITSRQLIDVIGVKFPALTYSQTCNWVSRFKAGGRCNYTGASTSCDGTWATCKTLGMTHRYGGLKNALIRGSYTYKVRRAMWFDTRKTGTYESQENTGIFGTVIPVIYGSCRVTADVVWQVDEGPINKFVGIIGIGPIEGPVAPPYNVPRDYLPGSNRIMADYNANPMISLNNKLMNDYALYFGYDGTTGYRTPSSADHGLQQVDYLWTNSPGRADTYSDPTTVGQTYSRMAHIVGAWKSSDNKEADQIDELELYVHGRKIPTYAKVDDHWVCTEMHSDNPGWVWLDILTNQDYGAGFPIELIDLEKTAVAAYVCDSEGFTFSHIFREQIDILDALALVAHSCRGYTGYSNGKFFLVAQNATAMINAKAAGPQFLFDNSSIVLGSDCYMAEGDEKGTNAIEVPYLDYDQDWQSVPRILEDAENIKSTGKKSGSGLKFVGAAGAGTSESTAVLTTITTADDPDLGYAIGATTPLWDVASTTGFSSGDYVRCDGEVCRISEVLSGQFKLSQNGNVRAAFNGSVASVHNYGAEVERVTVSHTGLAAANKLAYYHLNRSRLMRRIDGRKRVKGGIETMHLQVGDIVKLDLSDLDMQDPAYNLEEYDGLYEIDSIRWSGNEAEYTLDLADPAIFDAVGIDAGTTITPVISRLKWPFNVKCDASDITEEISGDYGKLLITWTIPDPTDQITPPPEWVCIYWRRESEATYDRKSNVVRVKASTGFARISIPWEIWDETIVIYLAPESAWGIEVPATPQKVMDEHTELVIDIDGITSTWPVYDASIFAAGDWIMCGDELCKVDSVDLGTNVIETTNDWERYQYEGTPRQEHKAHTAVHKAEVVVTNVAKYIRNLSDTTWSSGMFSVTTTGPTFVARWENPAVVWSVRDDPNNPGAPYSYTLPDWCIHHWEIAYSPTKSFDPDITDDTDPLYDHDAVWVTDIPGGVHEKQGTDPGKTYYFAMRPVFFNSKTKAWKFQMEPTPWPPTPGGQSPSVYWRRAITSRQSATTLLDPLGTEPLLLNSNCELTGINLSGMTHIISDATLGATEWTKLDSNGLSMYQNGHTCLNISISDGLITIGDYPSGQYLAYSTATKRMTAKLYSVSTANAIGGNLITKQSWTANGVDTTFDLPYLRATNSDPIVSVNGIIQSPSTNYTVSDGLTYTSVTFSGFTPASGDAIICFYQKK